MSSVHYKFKATFEYKTLTFAGLHIGVDELKKAICDKENIRTESFDLLITNAHTRREYTTGDLVPRNSALVVQRLLRALKLPKVRGTTNGGIVQRSSGVFQSNTYISSDDFSELTDALSSSTFRATTPTTTKPITAQNFCALMRMFLGSDEDKCSPNKCQHP